MTTMQKIEHAMMSQVQSLAEQGLWTNEIPLTIIYNEKTDYDAYGFDLTRIIEGA